MNTCPHTVVLGLGESGEAAARLLRREGGAVTVLDAGRSRVLDTRARRLSRLGVRVRLGASPQAWPIEARACVVSPGIPVDSPWLLAARANGIRGISELELGWSRLNTRTLAVTGSNGKSTLVAWLTEAIKAAGATVRSAGNIGFPVSRLALEKNTPDWLVLEVSSFQLETVSDFRPDTGVLLNVFPNHLDRHGSLAAYRKAKSRLFARMNSTDTAVVPSRWRGPMARRSRSAGRWITFGTGRSCDYRWGGGGVYSGREKVLELAGTWFDNEILGPTGAAAAAAVKASGLPVQCLADTARQFRPLPHRMEPVGEQQGILFIDDSKATNLAALAAGLRQLSRPARLIAGGMAKNDAPESVKEMLAHCCRGVYLMGRDARYFAERWADVVPCVLCETLDRAFSRAVQDARRGEAVLLSPGCASFDQFENFEERGAVFQQYARQWMKSVSPLHLHDAETDHEGRKGRR